MCYPQRLRELYADTMHDELILAGGTVGTISEQVRKRVVMRGCASEGKGKETLLRLCRLLGCESVSLHSDHVLAVQCNACLGQHR